MSATVQQAFSNPRFPLEREVPPGTIGFDRSGRLPSAASRPVESAHQWLVDLTALARCRALFAGHGSAAALHAAEHWPSNQSLMHIPPAYDLFCRTHFASVKRVHPDLAWEDACPAYAIALSAHAVLCVALDDEREKQLELHWDRIRGQSCLAWSQARSLIADGCSALDRLDPLAMHR